jgi:hypothetical protein
MVGWRLVRFAAARAGVALVLAAALGAAAPALAQSRQQSGDEGPSILGPWTGTYTCLQGLTAVSLTVTEAHAGRAEALFHFYADPSNPGVPTGCFTQSGTYNPRTRQLALRGGRWLLQPDGYLTVGFAGRLDVAGTSMTGKVLGPRGCTTFRLARQDASAPVPAQCRPQVALGN